MSEPKIPFGFKQVPAYAPTQKGDGKWDGTKFRKVKKDWPRVDVEDVVIRKCEVEQTELLVETKILPCMVDAAGNTVVTLPDGSTEAYAPAQLAGLSVTVVPAKGCRIFDFEDE